MNTTWIIEPLRTPTNFSLCIDESIQRLSNSVMNAGFDVRYERFNYGATHYDFFGTEGKVIFQGSINFAKQLSNMQHGCEPLLYLTEDNYRCKAYMPLLKEFMLNHDYTSIPVKNVDIELEGWLTSIGNPMEFYARPDSGMKPFSGGAFNYYNFKSIVWGLVGSLMNANEEIIFAPLKSIASEYRFVCSDYKMITGCQYVLNGELDFNPIYPREVELFLFDVLDAMKAKSWQPDRVYVLDICKLSSGEPRLMEFNSFSCAGLYACDTDKIVKVISNLQEIV